MDLDQQLLEPPTNQQQPHQDQEILFQRNPWNQTNTTEIKDSHSSNTASTNPTNSSQTTRTPSKKQPLNQENNHSTKQP